MPFSLFDTLGLLSLPVPDFMEVLYTTNLLITRMATRIKPMGKLSARFHFIALGVVKYDADIFRLK